MVNMVGKKETGFLNTWSVASQEIWVWQAPAAEIPLYIQVKGRVPFFLSLLPSTYFKINLNEISPWFKIMWDKMFGF